MSTILRLSKVSKAFPGVQALDMVDLEIEKGEVHALLGENGAGKSTLVKIIAGVYRRDQGEVVFDGQERSFSGPAEAAAAGITVIHQETSLIPTLTVMENVFLGREPRSFAGLIDSRRMRAAFGETCALLDFRLPADRPARELSVAGQKMTEIMKAMVRQATFIIMDEPTDALSDVEIQHLFRIIRDLKGKLITVVYITHFIEEVFTIADRATVLRDGRKVATRPAAELDRNAIVKMMIGQELAVEQDARPVAPGAVRREALSVQGLTRGTAVRGVSFSAYQGEILGITGVLGSGKTELARLLFGADKPDSGMVSAGGRVLRISSPRDAVANGIGMLPEDRKRLGLILGLDVSRNISIAALRRFCRGPVVRRGAELEATGRITRELGIKATGPDQQVRYLSGGNQQKVVLAKWLISGQKTLIMDEPTRGIDVGSKAEIHRIMRALADGGACVIFISSEVPEIVRVSDRVLVMRGGRIAAVYSRGVNQEEIVHRMLSGGGE